MAAASVYVEGYLQASLADTSAAVRPALLAHALRLTQSYSPMGEPILDHAAAEDLVQDAYVRMLERPPRSRSKAKVQGWLMIVMRNLWADRFPRHATLNAEERGQALRIALRGGRGPRELPDAAGADSLDA